MPKPLHKESTEKRCNNKQYEVCSNTHVDNERIVTWIRYGVTQSRQKVLKNDETLEKKIKLKDENMKILNNSKFKDVLSDIVELN